MISYSTIAEFLDPKSARALLVWTLASEASFAPSRIDYGVQDASFRRSLSVRPDKPIRVMLRSNLEARLPGILKALGMPPFAYQLEIEAVAYNEGAHLKRHVDLQGGDGTAGARPRVNRRLSVVYYYYREPKCFTGGQLRLYPLLPGPSLDIEPRQNLLVAFPALAPHEVMPVSCPSGRFSDSRFTINLWLHVAAS